MKPSFLTCILSAALEATSGGDKARNGREGMLPPLIKSSPSVDHAWRHWTTLLVIWVTCC